MGRKTLGDTAMTPAERQRRHRARHKFATAATAHRDLYLLAVHVRRLIKLLKVASKKYPLVKDDDGVPFPIKLEMMKASFELSHLLHALGTGRWSPGRQTEFDEAEYQRRAAETNRRPGRKELERREKRAAALAATPRTPTYLFPQLEVTPVMPTAKRLKERTARTA